MNEKPTRRSGGSRLKEGVVKEKQAFWKLGLSGGGNVPGERYSLISVFSRARSGGAVGLVLRVPSPVERCFLALYTLSAFY
jgi:hypothetical protein